MIRLGICNELFEGWEFGQVCRTVKALGYDGLEIAPFTLAPRITDLTLGRLRELRSMAEDSGVAVIGLHWLLAKTEGFYLTTPDAAVRRKTGDYLLALAEATRVLGGELMVLGSPKQRDLLPGVTYDQAIDYAVAVFERIMPEIGGLGVDLCLEPLAPSETNFLNTCAQANAMIARVNHPHFKLHMDVKAQSGETAATVPELIARHAAHGGPLPRPGRQPPRAGDGRRRFRPDPEGPRRHGLRPLGLGRGLRFLAGRRGDRAAEHRLPPPCPRRRYGLTHRGRTRLNDPWGSGS